MNPREFLLGAAFAFGASALAGAVSFNAGLLAGRSPDLTADLNRCIADEHDATEMMKKQAAVISGQTVTIDAQNAALDRSNKAMAIYLKGLPPVESLHTDGWTLDIDPAAPNGAVGAPP